MARWIQWYGHGREGQADITSGRGSVEDIVAHHKDVHNALDRHQAIIAARARINLSMRARRRSGSMTIGTLGAPPTMLDRYVYMADSREGNWWQSAVSFEMGHWYRGKGGSSKWVPGAWVIHDAAGLPHD